MNQQMNQLIEVQPISQIWTLQFGFFFPFIKIPIINCYFCPPSLHSQLSIGSRRPSKMLKKPAQTSSSQNPVKIEEMVNRESNKKQDDSNHLLQTVMAYLRDMKHDIQSQLHGIDKRVDGIDKRVDSIDKRVDSIDKRVDNIDKRVDNIDKRVDNIDKRVAKLEQTEIKPTKPSLEVQPKMEILQHESELQNLTEVQLKMEIPQHELKLQNLTELQPKMQIPQHESELQNLTEVQPKMQIPQHESELQNLTEVQPKMQILQHESELQNLTEVSLKIELPQHGQQSGLSNLRAVKLKMRQTRQIERTMTQPDVDQKGKAKERKTSTEIEINQMFSGNFSGSKKLRFIKRQPQTKKRNSGWMIELEEKKVRKDQMIEFLEQRNHELEGELRKEQAKVAMLQMKLLEYDRESKSKKERH